MIGLGGGSSIDSSKAIAVMATNEGDYWDYVSGGSGKGMPVPIAPLPIVAITTTAGTGTEAEPWTVITNGHEKVGFGYDKTFPDALFHSTEGYVNVTANEMSNLFALKAISLIGKSLIDAVNDGDNEEARGNVALANTLSGIVESTSGCTSEHSIEHALSAYHPELPHGAGLIMISKAYYAFLAESDACKGRMVAMAKALGKSDAKEAKDFVAVLVELQKSCGVDNLKMSDYGIKEKEIPKIAENARETMGGLFAVDPCVIDHESVIGILKESYR